MERTEEHLAWLALNRLPQIAGGRCLQLAQHFGSATAVLKASVPAWEEIIGKAAAQEARAEPVAWDWAEAQWKMLEQRGGHLLSLADPDYPALLLETASPPAVLHVLGEIPEDTSCLSIVGTREPTAYGREVARQLARALTVRGFCVVSGMARGIDTAAHQGALEAGGKTLAVLGCGVDVVYPADNRELYARIQQQGAVLSEFPMGSPPQAGWFPRRNRVISGLSAGVILVEAPARSGALITARYAQEQNREVFAVPGDIRTLKSAGCHRLIRDGAVLVEKVEDVLEELQHLFPRNQVVQAALAPPVPELSARQRTLLEQLDGDPRHIDQLAQGAALEPAELLGALLELELAGLVEQLPGKYFVRVY